MLFQRITTVFPIGREDRTYRTGTRDPGADANVIASPVPIPQILAHGTWDRTAPPTGEMTTFPLPPAETMICLLFISLP